MIPSGELLQSALETVDAWSAVAGHPGVVPLRAAFVSAEVEGTPSLYLVYDYVAAAVRAMLCITCGGVFCVPRCAACV